MCIPVDRTLPATRSWNGLPLTVDSKSRQSGYAFHRGKKHLTASGSCQSGRTSTSIIQRLIKKVTDIVKSLFSAGDKGLDRLVDLGDSVHAELTASRRKPWYNPFASKKTASGAIGKALRGADEWAGRLF